jgi:hypothetical protein
VGSKLKLEAYILALRIRGVWHRGAFVEISRSPLNPDFEALYQRQKSSEL